MKRLTGSITLALLGLVLLAGPAAAGREWCYRDPVVSLNGTAVQILVAVPDAYVPAVNGPIEVQVGVPDGVAHEIVFLDAGFNGHGETVSVRAAGGSVAADGAFDARIRVRVPVSRQMLAGLGLAGSVPVQVTVITNGDLTWEAGLPVVAGGNTTVAEGTAEGTKVDVRIEGSN